MISALYGVPFDAAPAQGELAVWASIFQPDKLSRFSPLGADILAQYRDLLKLAGDLVIPRSDVPRILQKHFQIFSI